MPISRFEKEACHKTTSCKNFFLHFKSESLRLSPSQIGEKLIQQAKAYSDKYKIRGYTKL